MKKIVIAAGVIAMTTVSASTFATGLTLKSHGATKNIVVFCGQDGPTYQGLLPIPANGSLPALSWQTIAMMFHSTNLQCTFKLDDGKKLSPENTIGTANVTIAANYATGQVSNAQEFLGYQAIISPSQGVNYADMTVTMQGSGK